MKINKGIDTILPYKPGKSKTSGMQKPIKLSSNENALGCSTLVFETIKNFSHDTIQRYPDGSHLALREAISKAHNIDAKNIVCGSGSDEILSLIGSAFILPDSEVILSRYSFLMYEIIAKKNGSKIVTADDKHLANSLENILSQITPKTSLIFIANPNNPTGTYFSKTELDSFLAKVPPSVLVVLDYAYAEFAKEIAPDYCDNFSYVKKYPNIVITRTFSKIYGIASFRVGFCFASDFICDILARIRGPFNLPAISQQVAIASLLDTDFITKSTKYNASAIKYLDQEIQKKYKTIPSVANFILFDANTEQNANKIFLNLEQNNIIVRQMDEYNLSSHLRVTVGLEHEIEAFLKHLI